MGGGGGKKRKKRPICGTVTAKNNSRYIRVSAYSPIYNSIHPDRSVWVSLGPCHDLQHREEQGPSVSPEWVTSQFGRLQPQTMPKRKLP